MEEDEESSVVLNRPALWDDGNTKSPDNAVGKGTDEEKEWHKEYYEVASIVTIIADDAVTSLVATIVTNPESDTGSIPPIVTRSPKELDDNKSANGLDAPLHHPPNVDPVVSSSGPAGPITRPHQASGLNANRDRNFIQGPTASNARMEYRQMPRNLSVKWVRCSQKPQAKHTNGTQ
jgi:hypothetical protein